ncbi:hypothetical protein HC928_12195, partial [bacterium]|nr:hypothetical protein [bacterium]
AVPPTGNRNLTNNVRVEPGTIVDFGPDSIVVKAIDGCVNIQQIRDCGRLFTYSAWVRARRVSIGEQFI